jgi:hypothetical protein
MDFFGSSITGWAYSITGFTLVLICKMLQKMQNEYQTVTENGGFCGFLYLTNPKCR